MFISFIDIDITELLYITLYWVDIYFQATSTMMLVPVMVEKEVKMDLAIVPLHMIILWSQQRWEQAVEMQRVVVSSNYRL